MGRLTPWKWIVDQWSTVPPVSQFKVDLSGKTVIITGANTGIGLAAAKHFAELGPKRLIIACRDEMKANNAMNSIRDATSYQTIEAWSLDLASFSSIRAFADRFEREGDGHLDILVQNAGAWFRHYTATEDGWESSIQVNHLGPSLLSLLLLPYLLKSKLDPPTPRLIIVASEGHFHAALPEARSPKILEKLNDAQYCKTSRTTMEIRYLTVKLLNIFFTRALASRLPTTSADSLTVACVNPGFCRTELWRTFNGPLRLIVYIGEVVCGRTPEVGSRNVVWAALGGEQGKVHGRYISRCRVEDESDFVLSEEGAKIEDRLWIETIGILSKVDRRVGKNVDEYLVSTQI